MIMNKMISKVGFITLLLTLAMNAFAAPQVSLEVTAEKDVTETNEQGEQVTRRVIAADTVPGDVLFYTIRYSNSGSEAARSVQVNNPIPDGTEYQANSAWGDGAEILFSIDGGASFKKPSSLTYQTTGRDGAQENRQAAPEQYNAIRWTIEEIAPGADGAAGFSVVVK